MGFWTLFEVASMPILQVLLTTLLGAFMATDYLNLLPDDARRSLNKIVFMVFTPSLIFATLAKTVTLQDIIAWWFMPVNIGITFLVGGILGWIAVKLLKPKPHLEGLIIATCSSGNLGNLMIILIPAICKENGNPFGDHDTCTSLAISYASFSLALGGLYIFTITYQLVRSSATRYKALLTDEEERTLAEPNKDLDANEESCLLEPSKSPESDLEADRLQIVSLGSASKSEDEHVPFWLGVFEMFKKVLQELMAPPTLGAIIGFIFGTIPWLKNLIIGDGAPLQVIQDSVKLLGDATIPCIILILGGNLTQGLRKAKVTPMVVITIICVRYMLMPVIGIGIIKAANHLGFLSSDPLFQFVLMIQFTLPPAMNIGTMTQLFNVAQVECSVIMLWTYLTAVVSLTVWSTVFMWILS